MISRTKRRSALWLVTAGAAATLAWAGTALSAPAQIESKQAEAQQVLLLNNLRNRVVLRTDGGMRTGDDIVKAAILGA